MNHEKLFSFGRWDKTSESIKKRILFWVLLVWLPPVVAIIIAKILKVETPDIGLFQDFAFHVRCLISIPILLMAEKIIFKGLNEVIPNALYRGVFRSDQTNILGSLSSQIYKHQGSIVIEILLLIFSITIVFNNLYIDLPPGISSWKTMNDTFYHFANGWNKWVGLTVYYFFILRWIYKFLLWCIFLFKFVLLKPHLQSLHPDKMGGISFIVKRHVSFGLVATAMSSVASANISSSIIFGKLSLETFYLPLGIYLAIMISIFLVPLFILTPLLFNAKRRAKHQYGDLAYSYAETFEMKWFNNNDLKPVMLGTSDIQSLNDLMGSYAELKTMRILPINHRMLVVLVLLIGLPLLPLGLFKIPLSEVLSLLLKHFI